MKILTRKVDDRARVTLFGDFAGQLVVVERLGDHEVRIRKARPAVKRYTLKQLVAGITPANVHPETPTGPSVGNESW